MAKSKIPNKAEQEAAVAKLKEERAQAATHVEDLFEQYRQRILPTFDGKLISGPRNPQALASHLSKQFPVLRVTVVYEDGAVIVTATPKVFLVDPHFHHYASADSIRAFPNVDNIKNQWPSFAEVAAYAQGYDKASASADELRELREENKILKGKTSHSGCPMMGHWYR